MEFNHDEDKKMAEKAEKRMAQALATSKGTSDTYIDQSQDVILTKGDINRMAFRSLALQASFNYERMQAGGWLYTILPALRKIHKNKDAVSYTHLTLPTKA